MATVKKSLQSYYFPILLIASILFGGLTGYFDGSLAQRLKPIGDLFLNLILTTIVPLIFFSVSAATARTSHLGKLGKMLGTMLLVFIITGFIAALLSLLVVQWFPPAQGVVLHFTQTTAATPLNLSEQIVSIFTVPEFSQLLSHKNILALIIFSMLVGLATSKIGESGQAFSHFLQAGEQVFMQVFSFIMLAAPIGFFCYFSDLVRQLGPQIMQNYFHVTVIYYVFGLIYFVIVYSLYAFCAAQKTGVKLFWKNILLPTATSLATCSSAASIPANLIATKNMGISAEVYETVVPFGALVHKEGSVIGGMFKIAFLFGLFHLSLSQMSVIGLALIVSVLVGTVMGAIPSGGMFAELLIVTLFGFPPQVLMAIIAISILIDPLATMLNVTGNTVSSMLVARLLQGKAWDQSFPTKIIENSTI